MSEKNRLKQPGIKTEPTGPRVTLTEKQKLTWALARLANAANVKLDPDETDAQCVERITESILGGKSLTDRIKAVETELSEIRKRRDSSRPPPANE